ncbi:hypothetical protein HBB16_03500 [Pseudonocardia sp. MCCB 268]|nr:hypothetical protein [Pseudonocardia cytotoxica]
MPGGHGLPGRTRCSWPGTACSRQGCGTARLVEQDLAGLTVTGVVSVSKHLFTQFDDGRSLHSHFRMDGAWHLYRPGTRWQRPRGPAPCWNRRPGSRSVSPCDLALLPTGDEHLVGHLGPDLLGPGCGLELRRGAAPADRPRRHELGLIAAR